MHVIVTIDLFLKVISQEILTLFTITSIAVYRNQILIIQFPITCIMNYVKALELKKQIYTLYTSTDTYVVIVIYVFFV